MRSVVDLSHPFAVGMPVYPGCAGPEIGVAHTVERDGFAELRVAFHTHTGTHIDAPAHMLAGAATLEDLGAGWFVGRAAVLEVAGRSAIDAAFLEGQGSALAGCDFVLFHTGWDRHWGTPAYFEGFPVLDPAAARWLAGRGLKGVGFDAISVDPVGSTTFDNHLLLFRAGLISIENLTGLAPLAGRSVLFSCLPLRLPGADGCPVRAVAILED